MSTVKINFIHKFTCIIKLLKKMDFKKMDFKRAVKSEVYQKYQLRGANPL